MDPGKARVERGDPLFGGAGDDHLLGSNGDDVLNGEEGDDVLAGCSGDDEIHGGGEDDVIFGGTGLDDIDGGDGDDRFYCRTAASSQPLYDPANPGEDCDDQGRPRVGIDPDDEEWRDPYQDWAHMVRGYNGAIAHYFTTSARERLLAEDALGATILLKDGEPLHRVHKQYGSSCGPASLAMVMDYLGLADPAQRVLAPRGLGYEGPFIVGDDWDWNVDVDLGYWLSPEHLMYEGLRYAYQEWWRFVDQRPSWWPRVDFVSEGGELNTANTGNCWGGVDCGSFFEIDYEIGNVQLNAATGDYSGPVQQWLRNTPGVGGTSLVHVANVAVPGVSDTTTVDLEPGNLEYVKAIIRAFVDHGIPFVVGVESGFHYNTVMGYWDADAFYVYTADPLDGWGRSGCWFEQPMRWRKTPLDEAAVQSGAMAGMILYGYREEGCVGSNPWARDVDSQYGMQVLCGGSIP